MYNGVEIKRERERKVRRTNYRIDVRTNYGEYIQVMQRCSLYSTGPLKKYCSTYPVKLMVQEARATILEGGG